MNVNGSATVRAPLSRVWNALQDPAVLVQTIPGCRRLEAVGADTYDMTVTAGVASIKGTYVGRVALSQPDPPHSFVLRAQGQGAPGTVDATVTIRLSEADGGTTVDYDADTVVGGMIGGVGQRMLGAVARKTADEFFTAVEHVLAVQLAEGGLPSTGSLQPTNRGPRPSAEPATEAPYAVAGSAMPAPGAVYTPPPALPAPSAASSGAWAMTTAFGAGGAIALLGVAVGYAIGRRR
jgi:carbon monoxide dehydrogenase subunit G